MIFFTVQALTVNIIIIHHKANAGKRSDSRAYTECVRDVRFEVNHFSLVVF